MQVCRKTARKLPSKKFFEICKQDSRNRTSLLKKITKGITLGFRECENQFRLRRWNCTSQRKSMKKVLLRGTNVRPPIDNSTLLLPLQILARRRMLMPSQVFITLHFPFRISLKLVPISNTAAAISYTIAKSCSMGELVECSCDKNLVPQNVLMNELEVPANADGKQNNKNRNKKPRKNGNNSKSNRNPNRKAQKRTPPAPDPGDIGEGKWEWSGCDDNINFGNLKSKDFLDARYKKSKSDIKTLVRIHNNNAGRLAIKKLTLPSCELIAL